MGHRRDGSYSRIDNNLLADYLHLVPFGSTHGGTEEDAAARRSLRPWASPLRLLRVPRLHTKRRSRIPAREREAEKIARLTGSGSPV